MFSTKLHEGNMFQAALPASLKGSHFCLLKNHTDSPPFPTLYPQALASHSLLSSYSGHFVEEMGQTDGTSHDKKRDLLEF